MLLSANGLQIEVDVQGPPNGTPVLLVMGLSMQLTAWPQALVNLLVARGCRVIRFDNRDVGLSQGFDAAGVPNMAVAGMRYFLHLPVRSVYSLADMAADAVGVLDALGIERAHVWGASMGGMVAQHLAASHAARVASLTLMMTTSGSRRLPQPGLKVSQALMSRPGGNDTDALVAHMERLWRVIGSPGYRPEPAELRARLRASVLRAWRPGGTARQLVAIVADGDRTAMLDRITQPTTVIHGADDPLVPVGCGEDLARRIRGATLCRIEGMGHDLPEPLLPRFVEALPIWR